MNLCACGCETPVQKTWARGHYSRKKGHSELDVATIDRAIELAQVNASDVVLVASFPRLSGEPPEYPHPIDRRVWRLAEDRPGIPQTNPWIKTQCHSCLQTMWTKDRLSTWEHGGVCEECGYILREDVGKQVVTLNTARTPYNPFA